MSVILQQVAPESVPDYVVLSRQFVELDLLNYPELLKEIKNYTVYLDPDPTAAGLASLNAKISQVDAFRSRVATVLGDAIENESKLDAIVRDAKRMYATQYDAWMLTPPVSDYKNKEQRVAAAEYVMALLKEFVDTIENSMDLAKSFTAQVKSVAEKLNSTNMNISRQVTVIQLQNEIGEIRRPMTQQPRQEHKATLITS